MPKTGSEVLEESSITDNDEELHDSQREKCEMLKQQPTAAF